ncbi:hypothetical protein PMIN03_005976 [Paraphaeosphaeria minitans]
MPNALPRAPFRPSTRVCQDVPRLPEPTKNTWHTHLSRCKGSSHYSGTPTYQDVSRQLTWSIKMYQEVPRQLTWSIKMYQEVPRQLTRSIKMYREVPRQLTRSGTLIHQDVEAAHMFSPKPIRASA